MKNAARNIKGFLESKGVEWEAVLIFDKEFKADLEADNVDLI